MAKEKDNSVKVYSVHEAIAIFRITPSEAHYLLKVYRDAVYPDGAKTAEEWETILKSDGVMYQPIN